MNVPSNEGYLRPLSLSPSAARSLVAVLFTPLGIALILGAIVIRMRDARFRRTSLRTKATIIDQNFYPYDDGVQVANRLRFIDSKGEEARVSLSI